MGRREGHWARYERDLAGAWHAIDDLREALIGPEAFTLLREHVDSMADAEMIAARVTEALNEERSRLLTGVRGWFVIGCATVTAAAAVFGALHGAVHTL